MHKMKMPRASTLIVLLILVIAAMFFIGKCTNTSPQPPLFAQSGSYPAKSGGDTIDVAIEISPLSFNLSDDSIQGLDYELLCSMAQLNDLKVKFHSFAPLDWAIKGLENGHFDILISSLQSTSTIKNQLPVTSSIYIDRQVLVQNVKHPKHINSPEDLGGDTVWIAKGSPVYQRIENLAREIGDTIYINDTQALTAEHVVMLTAAGTVSRCVVSEGLALAMTIDNNSLDISTPISFNQFQVWAVSSKNKKLLQRLNNMLDAFKQTASYQAIIDKYFVTQATR